MSESFNVYQVCGSRIGLADKVSEIRENFPLLLQKEPYGVHFFEQASDQSPGLIFGPLKQKWEHGAMILGKSQRTKRRNNFYCPFHVFIELCPNCARQGQIFPNGSKRNQKKVKKIGIVSTVCNYNIFKFSESWSSNPLN